MAKLWTGKTDSDAVRAPQPARPNNPAATSTPSSREKGRLRRNMSRKTAPAATASSGLELTLCAVAARVLTVIVTGAEDAPGTTAGGEKLAVAPAGRPLALRVTAPVKGAPCEPTMRLNVVDEPAMTVCCELPVMPRVKSGNAFTASITLADSLPRKFVSPE